MYSRLTPLRLSGADQWCGVAIRVAAAVSACLLIAGCGVVARGVDNFRVIESHAGDIGRSGKLTAQEMKWARIAWRYFEANTQLESGLVNGTDRSPVFTVWQTGDYLAAMIAAREIGLINERDFDLRMSQLLRFLNTMELSDGKLPNKAYSAISGKAVNFANEQKDTGWSAVDIGRLLMWMKITQQRYPRYAEYFDKAALRWDFCQVIDGKGVLYGASREGGQLVKYQEGRLGLEQLAGAGFSAWGLPTGVAASLPKTEVANILGQRVHFDARDPRTSGAPAPVLTMPYVYMGMEQSWRNPETAVPARSAVTPTFRQLAETVYRVQEARYLKEGLFTARSDYRTPSPPYQVLDSVYASGYAWNTVDSENKEYESLALVSTRAAFGLWALWQTDYTDRLIDLVQSFHDPQRGWYEGRLEATGAPQTNITLTTNAAVLQALLFKVKGELHARRSRPRPVYFKEQRADEYALQHRCTAGAP